LARKEIRRHPGASAAARGRLKGKTMSTTRPLTDEEYAAVVASIRGRMAKRDRCLIIMLRRTGFRISELLSLRLEDVIDQGQILPEIEVERRHTKGKRHSRKVPLHREAREALTAWLRKMARLGWQTKGCYLFVSLGYKNRPISRGQAWRIIQRAAKGPKSPHLAGSIGPHSLRKALGMSIYERSGRDIRATQVALGHASLDSTIHYLAVAEDRVRALILDDGPAPGPAAP
jgi:integrase